MTREEFKTIRRRLGYSQEALARVIGVKAQSVSRYEMLNSARQRRGISEILAHGRVGVNARTEKAPHEARPGIPREKSMRPLGMGSPAGY